MRIDEKTAKIQLAIQRIPHHTFETRLTIGLAFLRKKCCHIQQQANNNEKETFSGKWFFWFQAIMMYVRLNLGFIATS